MTGNHCFIAVVCHGHAGQFNATGQERRCSVLHGSRRKSYFPAMAEITIERAIEIALQHQQSGRRAEAEIIYLQLQNAVEDNPIGLVGLGSSAATSGTWGYGVAAFSPGCDASTRYGRSA